MVVFIVAEVLPYELVDDHVFIGEFRLRDRFIIKRGEDLASNFSLKIRRDLL